MKSRGSRAPVAVLVGLAASLAPRPVAAHLVNGDLGAFYGGALHPLTAPEHLLPIVALALLAGQQGAATARHVLVAFPLGMAAGSALAFAGYAWPGAHAANLASLLLLGALVAGNWRLPRGTTEGLASLFGATHGYPNGTSAVASALSQELFLLGLVTTALVVVTLVPAFVVRLGRGWGRVAVRVVGSWIAAVGLLMAALALRTGGS